MGLGPPASLRLRLLCPAKINLHLRVGPRRDDGFHPLLTWMCTVGLFDTLTLQTLPGPRGSSDESSDEASAGPRAVREGSGRDTSPHAQPPTPGEAGAAGAPPADADLPAGAKRTSATHVSATRTSATGAGDARPPGVAGGSGSAGGQAAGSPGIASSPGDQWPRGPGEGGCDERSTLSGGAPTIGEVAAVLLETDSPGLPCDQRNLVVRIAAAWAGEPPPRLREGHGFFPVRAVLEKRIPVGAGLGGGSSDAARTLLGLERLRRGWLNAIAAAGGGRGVQETAEQRRPANDLSAFAGRFGSDVPFFVRAAFPPPDGGPSAVCTGRGEVVTPVAPPAARWAVLVLPEIALPTADVYRRFDEMGLGRREDIDAAAAPDWPAWSRLAAKDLLPRLVNDLEAPAFSLRPDLADLRAAAEQALGRTVRMSGSGSSLFTLFDSRADAGAAAAGLRKTLRVRTELVELTPRIEDDLAVNDSGEPL